MMQREAIRPVVRGVIHHSVPQARLPFGVLEACRSALVALGGPGLPVLGVTSAVRGEGRTTVALALALAQAESGISTTLVELDLEKPSLAPQLDLEEQPGLGEVAARRTGLSQAVHQIDDDLLVVPAGQLKGSPWRVWQELIESDALGQLRGDGQCIVLDLGPLTSPVGQVMARRIEPLVLVVRAGETPVPVIRDAIAGLPAPPSVLLNGVTTAVPGFASRLLGTDRA